MAKMTKAQADNMIKVAALEALNIPENAYQIDNYAYAIPVVVEDETRYAVLTLTAKNNKDTKTAPAFDPQRVCEAWQARLAEAEEKRRAKAEEKARREAERAAKKAVKTAEVTE